VYVSVKTKTGSQQTFTEAPLKNARNSAVDPGVVCFDVLLDQQDDTTFVLVEILKQEKKIAHYLPSTAPVWDPKNNFEFM
jgi:quinol monooxygenase YgiN